MNVSYLHPIFCKGINNLKHTNLSKLYVVRRHDRLAPHQPLSVCTLLPAPREEQASTASWKPQPPFEAAEMD